MHAKVAAGAVTILQLLVKVFRSYLLGNSFFETWHFSAHDVGLIRKIP